MIARLRQLLLDPPAELRKREAYPLYLARLGVQLGKQWARDRCPQIAGALTFQTVLCLVPLLAVASALLQSTGQFSADAALVKFLSDRVFPAIGIDLFEHLMDFVANVRKGALGPFGIAITLVISFTLYRSVENVFAQIWRVRHGRPLLGKFLIFYTLATLLPLLFGLSLSYWSGASGPLVSFATTFVALVLLNKMLPRTIVRWKAALAGAAVSALLFEVAKYGFAAYLSGIALSRYKGVYGPVAVIPILLVWVYVAWLVVLFGAECAHAAQNLRTLEALERRARGDGPLEVNAVIALRLVAEIAGRFRRGDPPLTEAEAALHFDLDEDTVNQISRRLLARRVIMEAAEPAAMLLARPAEQLLLDEVMEPFRPPDARTAESLPRLDALLRELEAARREKVGALTVADLLEPI